MNTLPPGQEPHDEVDDLYRRASARDPSGPSEATRRAVLAHAERLAAARLTPPRRRLRHARWWPAAFGTLAAAVLAALLVVPSQFGPGAPAPSARKPAELTADASRARTISAAEPAPKDQAASASDRERRTAGVPAAPPPGPPALALRKAEHPADRSHVAPEPAAQAAEQRAESLMQVAPGDADTSHEPVALNGAPKAPARAGAGAAARDSQPEEAADALHRAAAAGDVAVLESLLAQPTAVDGRDAAGRTALLVAVLHGRAQAIATLLAHGADPNAADAAGTTPLAAARARGDAPTAEMLRRHGAR